MGVDKLEMWLSKKEQGFAIQEQQFVCYGAQSKDEEPWVFGINQLSRGCE